MKVSVYWPYTDSGPERSSSSPRTIAPAELDEVAVPPDELPVEVDELPEEPDEPQAARPAERASSAQTSADPRATERIGTPSGSYSMRHPQPQHYLDNLAK